MTSPMVENFSSVPVFMAVDDDETGFPFDREERDNSFQTQLDDLAKRHPQFAEHLNPAGWAARPRRTSGSGQRESPSASSHEFPTRFRESPFGSRTFDQFFPFDREFEDPVYYTREQPNAHQQPPHQQQTQQQGQSNCPQNTSQDSQQPQTQVPDNSQKPPPGPAVPQERSRRQQNSNNIQQSNTVDLGQKQEPVDADSRNQRSMSAPPENRSAGKRFVSSVNIPNLNPGPAGDMGGRMSQPDPTPQQTKPNERIIPIHIEGRDEPVIPKNANTTFRQPSPQREQIFGQNKDFYKQFFDNQQQHQQQPQHHQQQPQHHQQSQQQHHQQPQHHHQQQQQGPSQEELQKAELLRQQQQYQKQQQEEYQRQKESEEVPPPPQQPPVQKPTPLDQIQLIQKDVSALMTDVENFDGKPRDKRYIYLDEMLTRNLLKLDNVETEGKDVIRQARKEAIKCIERCISHLEAIAVQNEKNANKTETVSAVEEEKSESPAVEGEAKEASPQPAEKEKSPAPVPVDETLPEPKADSVEKGEGDKTSQAETTSPEQQPEDLKEKKKAKKKSDKK